MERDIRPIFKEHCFDCHGAAEKVEGGLDLRLVRFMVSGGESGSALAPGKPSESLLLDRIKAGEMPPTGKKVPAEQIAKIEQWILTGANTAQPEPEKIDPGIGITAAEREFWSFQPIVRPEIPMFTDSDRVRTPIDAFLLAEMRPHGLNFSADADKQTLIKRIHFDLIGLPPTADQMATFMADQSPGAYEALVDRLLESPHYGERWARHWLDVAGYADSEGYTDSDADRPWAYFYRDYVIRAMNADKPFDQFIHEQLAGDELVPPPYNNLTPDQIEKLTATGFLRLAADGTGSGANDDQARNQTIADTIKIVSTSLLGLSVGWRSATITDTIQFHRKTTTRCEPSWNRRWIGRIGERHRNAWSVCIPTTIVRKQPRSKRKHNRSSQKRRPSKPNTSTKRWTKSSQSIRRRCEIGCEPPTQPPATNVPMNSSNFSSSIPA